MGAILLEIFSALYTPLKQKIETKNLDFSDKGAYNTLHALL